jgi:nucleoside-diphosphate-sugar epimerase
MEITKHNKTALVFGATGLVGGYLVNFLLLHPAYKKVVVFVRRPMDLEHEKLVQHVIDFDRPEKFQSLVKGDDIFCCLGTTMAMAGSKAAFYKVINKSSLKISPKNRGTVPNFVHCFTQAKVFPIRAPSHH